ncbi:hypothetical protein HKD37_20G055947 [Glycine soja]
MSGILEVVYNPWRFILGNWFCDSDLDNLTGIDRVLIEKDLLADSYSDLEAFILDEKEFLLLKSPAKREWRAKRNSNRGELR